MNKFLIFITGAPFDSLNGQTALSFCESAVSLGHCVEQVFFYQQGVHHANIDRLWAAWTATGNGRTQPPASDGYWTQSLRSSRTVNGTKFNYGSGLDMDRQLTFETRSTLFYEYDDLTLWQ